tara:strand:+ start:696 stop:923 length:228 start_codon:yes stop_codon:yes gene_type:complete
MITWPSIIIANGDPKTIRLIDLPGMFKNRDANKPNATIADTILRLSVAGKLDTVLFFIVLFYNTNYDIKTNDKSK